MGVTLQQIADLAGVHKSTVDKVIHNRPGVSDAKRQLIRKLLQEQGYEANPLAKALNYQKDKKTVAVVLPLVDAVPELKRGAERMRQDFNSFNIEIQYYEPDSAEEEANCLNRLCTQKIAGVVVNPIDSESVRKAFAALHNAQIPVITVNSDLTDSERLCFVGQDMKESGQTAVRLTGLLLGGQGKIAVISSSSLYVLLQRKQAFLEYLTQCFPAVQPVETIDIQETPESAIKSTQELLERHPNLDGLFITCGCVPDICRAVRESGRKLSIICYERYPSIVELVCNGEVDCTISGDLEEQGRLAMRLMFEYIVYGHKPQYKQIYTKNEILFKENI